MASYSKPAKTTKGRNTSMKLTPAMDHLTMAELYMEKAQTIADTICEQTQEGRLQEDDDPDTMEGLAQKCEGLALIFRTISILSNLRTAKRTCPNCGYDLLRDELSMHRSTCAFEDEDMN